MDVESKQTILDAEDHAQAAATTVLDRETAALKVAGSELISEAQRALAMLVNTTVTPDLQLAVKDAADQLHGVLDRVNGTKLVMSEGGFQVVIPERKASN